MNQTPSLYFSAGIFRPVLVLLLLLNLCSLHAQKLSAFRHYTFISDFPQNTVQAIYQDANGYIWVGTESGLNRYDGKRILNYKIGFNDNFTLSGKSINNITEDQDGNLWVGSDRGLTLFSPDATPAKNERLQLIADKINKAEPGKNLECLKILRNNKTVLGYRPGISIYDPVSGTLLTKSQFPYNGTQVSPFVVSISEDSKQHIVAITNKHGVYILDNELRILQHFPLELFTGTGDLSMHYGVLLPDDQLMIASVSGLFKLDLQKNSSPEKIKDQQGFPISTMQFNCLAYDPDKKQVLAGSNAAGIFTFDTNGILVDHLADNAQSKKLQSNNIFFLLVDKHGLGYWVGNGKGLIKFFFQEDQFYSQAAYDNEGSPMRVYPIYTADNKNLLIGTEKQLLNYDISSGTFLQLPAADNKELRFNYIYQANEDLLLFCTKYGVYYSAGIKNIQLKKLSGRYPELKFTDSLNILCALRISNTEILFGARELNGGRLLRWNSEKKTLEKFEYIANDPETISNNTVNYLTLSPTGEIIVCTNNGICLFNNQTGRFKRLLLPGKNGINYPQVNAVLAEQDTWWIGTYGGGLNKFNYKTGKIEYITEKQGIANDDIYAIYRGAGDQLWMSTNRGLVQYNTRTGKIRNYDQADGLINNEFNRTSSFKRGDTLYFGGINGFSFFNYTSVQKNNLSPLAGIEKISLLQSGGEKSLFADSLFTISLRYYENTLKFYLSSPFYINPGKTIFLYRILPGQKDWISNGYNNELILTQVPPGNHTLEVKSQSSEGIESSNTYRLFLRISPPWYATWWVKLLSILCISAILFAFYKMRVNQLRNENRIRNQLASDLHDDLGSTMNSVKVYASLAMMEKKPEKYLPLIQESTQEAIIGIRDIIWVLDDSKDRVEHLLTRISNFATPLCEANDIRFIQDISDEVRAAKLGQEERRNLYMMLKEVVNNAIKYAGGQSINIRVALAKGKPVLELYDDGKGFDISNIKEGNGLKNLQRRAAEIHYRLTIDTAQGNGTRIVLEKK